MKSYLDNKELAIKLGRDIKNIRILKNLRIEDISNKTYLSKATLNRLELGRPTTLNTLLLVIAELGKLDWLDGLAPIDRVYAKNNKRIRFPTNLEIEKLSLNHKIRHLIKTYGITLEQYISMYDRQEGRCGNLGCENELNLKKASTHVDHDHKTGKVRSLLCSGCNAALGFLKENTNRANGLANYISKHS